MSKSAQLIRISEEIDTQPIKTCDLTLSQPLPTLYRKALEAAGIVEKDHPEFLSWAFGGPLPVTFTEFSAKWNERFGNKMWLSLTQFPKYNEAYRELWSIFSRMGALFCEYRRDLKAKVVHAIGLKSVNRKTFSNKKRLLSRRFQIRKCP